MSGLLGLKMSLKSVAKSAVRISQRNQSVCAAPVASFDDKSNKVTFHYLLVENNFLITSDIALPVMSTWWCLTQTPYHAALLLVASAAAIAACASTSSCDADSTTNHKVKHQDLKNSDPVAWARDSSSEYYFHWTSSARSIWTHSINNVIAYKNIIVTSIHPTSSTHRVTHWLESIHRQCEQTISTGHCQPFRNEFRKNHSRQICWWWS